LLQEYYLPTAVPSTESGHHEAQY